jgi:spore maturation protein CgeB
MTENETGGGASDRHILIAGPPYRGYLDQIAHAFGSCGPRVSVLGWDYARRGLVQDARFYASASYRSRLADAQDRLNTAAIEKEVEELSPDHVLVMKAAALSPRTVKLCESRGTKLALWAYDSAREYPLIARTAADYDLIYTYEPNDLGELSELGKAAYLPMGYDPGTYFPTGGAQAKDTDICFIGSLRDTPVRKRMLRFVAGAFPDRSVGVWTDTIHWYSHRRLKDLRFTLGRGNIELTRRTVVHAEINGIYNRSRVCLNVHHPQSVGALNPRSFEILGSGGLLLTDRDMKDLEGFGDGGGYAHYSTDEELADRVRSLLEDEELRRRTAEKGHAAAAKAHTYKHRALRILKDLD